MRYIQYGYAIRHTETITLQDPDFKDHISFGDVIQRRCADFRAVELYRYQYNAVNVAVKRTII